MSTPFRRLLPAGPESAPGTSGRGPDAVAHGEPVPGTVTGARPPGAGWLAAIDGTTGEVALLPG